MWKLEVYVKCVYTHTHRNTHKYIVYSEREKKVVLMSLSEGTTGGRRGKENTRE
jgi:hypothetical protein